MSRSSGFTLIEMLVVIAMMALLAAAVPFVNHSFIDRVRLTFAVRSVTARIAMAEAHARAQNMAICLTAPALQNGVAVAVRFQDAADGHPANSLYVYPDGSATPATLILDAGRLARILTVNALDGRVDAGT